MADLVKVEQTSSVVGQDTLEGGMSVRDLRFLIPNGNAHIVLIIVFGFASPF